MSRPTSDAFDDAVDDARRRLSLQERREVTIAELARRTGHSRSNLYYHLSKRRGERRQVPADLVEALARVLPISEADLMRAAGIASGYGVREAADELPDVRGLIVRHINAAQGKRAKLLAIADLQELLTTEFGRVLAQEGPI